MELSKVFIITIQGSFYILLEGSVHYIKGMESCPVYSRPFPVRSCPKRIYQPVPEQDASKAENVNLHPLQWEQETPTHPQGERISQNLP